MIWIGRSLVVVAVIVLGLTLPSLFFDDAYITFRYAANLAAGEGFTYNPPERVLGVTTPLFTLLLAAGARAGIDIETWALLLGLAGHAALALVVLEAGRDVVGGTDAASPRASASGAAGAAAPGGLAAQGPPLAAALACALYPHLAITAVGGMETSIWCALVVAAPLAASRGRHALAGITLGLGVLTRPDGALLAAPAIWLAWKGESGDRSRRSTGPFRIAAWSSAVAVPWLIFATSYFGSPAPHSVAAKRQIHPAGPVEVLAEFGRFVHDEPVLWIALPLAAWGTWAARRRPIAVALAGFGVLYLAACAGSGVAPFPWYVNPLLPVAFLLAAAGVDDLVSRAAGTRQGGAPATGAPERGRAAVWAAVVVAIVAGGGATLRAQATDLRIAWEEWEGVYEIVAAAIRTRAVPGESVYVGEVGIIGYLLPDQVIIDSSGINSPLVHSIRRGFAETDPEWSRQVVRRLSPDWITTSTVYLNIRELARESWFAREYEQVPQPLVEAGGQVILKRRGSS